MIDDEERRRLEAVRYRRPPGEEVTLHHDTHPTGLAFTTNRNGVTLSGVVDHVDGRLELVSLTLRYPRGITTSGWRGVRLGELIEEVRASAMLQGFGTWVYVKTGVPAHSPATRRRARQLAEAAAGSELKRGRRGYEDDHYRRIAILYLDLASERPPGGLLRAMAEAESTRSGREVPIETVRTWVNRARKRGFLARGRPGRVTAEPGPHLYEF